MSFDVIPEDREQSYPCHICENGEPCHICENGEITFNKRTRMWDCNNCSFEAETLNDESLES